MRSEEARLKRVNAPFQRATERSGGWDKRMRETGIRVANYKPADTFQYFSR